MGDERLIFSIKSSPSDVVVSSPGRSEFLLHSLTCRIDRFALCPSVMLQERETKFCCFLEGQKYAQEIQLLELLRMMFMTSWGVISGVTFTPTVFGSSSSAGSQKSKNFCKDETCCQNAFDMIITAIREQVIKKYGIIWEFFPTRVVGVSSIPKPLL